ncbi:MAG: hypothetical protein CVU46_01220 [Chloroflexi bacterium HGW-Chloroflexi-8]|nr:MAG: hypothetical protein CVU46_01220 [Chloroflexi bacterium HGW-Chloroflexi-8]
MCIEGQQLWTRWYFASSKGNLTDVIITEYIEKQGQKVFYAGIKTSVKKYGFSRISFDLQVHLLMAILV